MMTRRLAVNFSACSARKSLAGVVLGTLIAFPLLAEVESSTEGALPEKSGTNALAGQTSPYLLQHQDDPVAWHPWGSEALALARREDKPIFLSIGFAVCESCRQMQRETFSERWLARMLNRGFVNIKVDRQERPELDAIYQNATRLITGHGGWPVSIFLTPELKPFFAGTYIPLRDRPGAPGMATVLQTLEHAWDNKRVEVEAQAEEVVRLMQEDQAATSKAVSEPPPRDLVDATLAALSTSFDAQRGGFGLDAKFPLPTRLLFLLEVADQNEAAHEHLARTLDEMARGGIFDQLGGGFHRHTRDGFWRLPRFEKMLYDNALLLEVYARWYARTQDPVAALVVRRTAAFLEREMRSPEGAFYSALGAESADGAGAFYLWQRDELERLLGPEEAPWLGQVLGFDGPPSFDETSYVLFQPLGLENQAKRIKLSPDELLTTIEPYREKLLTARDKRPRPLTDTQILTDWNGLAIAGLATAGRLLAEPRLVAAAARAARFLIAHRWPKDRSLQHVRQPAEDTSPAFLGDYVFLIRGFLALHAATADEEWLRQAVRLSDEQIRRLRDPAGGFFDAGASSDLVLRSKDIVDGAVPGLNASAALNFIELAERTGEDRWWAEAEAILATFGSQLRSRPEACPTLALAVERYYAAKEPPAAEDPTDASVSRMTGKS